jgi:hypothetical protein
MDGTVRSSVRGTYNPTTVQLESRRDEGDVDADPSSEIRAAGTRAEGANTIGGVDGEIVVLDSDGKALSGAAPFAQRDLRGVRLAMAEW